MRAPVHSFISLTEAVTGILDGAELTDNQASEARAFKEQQNRDKWWDYSGPEYLEKGLELIATGRTLISRDGGSEDIVAMERSWFAKVEKWLAASGLTALEALEEVRKTLEAEHVQLVRKAVLYGALWALAAKGDCELWGLRYDDAFRVGVLGGRRSAATDYEKIPKTYFFRPVMHSMGAGYHGKGEVAPALFDDDEVFRSVFSDDVDADRRPSYLRVMISREHANQLAKDFANVELQVSSEIKRTSAIEANCLQWLIGKMNSSDPKYTTKRSLYEAACNAFPGIGNSSQQEISRSFDRVWTKAVEVAGEEWSRMGRRKNGGAKKGAPK